MASFGSTTGIAGFDLDAPPQCALALAKDQLGAFDTQSFTIEVGNVNDPPTITSSPVTTATEGLLYTYDVDATDPDAGDTLTYSLDTAPVRMSINSGSGVIDWTPTGQMGSHPVTVRVQDTARVRHAELHD